MALLRGMALLRDFAPRLAYSCYCIAVVYFVNCLD